MSNENILQSFLHAADAWLCDEYAVDIRYMAEIDGVNTSIWDASIMLNPLPPSHDLSFRVISERFVVEQFQCPGMTKLELQSLIAKAAIGEIEIADRTVKLATDRPLSYFSEMLYRERWFSPLHIKVNGAVMPPPTTIELVAIDNALRVSEPPFDGLADAATWLGLIAPGTHADACSINIRVGPPVDLVFDECQLSENRLALTLHAHSNFDVGRVRLAVRSAPGVALNGRKQIADMIVWGNVSDNRRIGVVEIELEQADNVLVMLLIEDFSVRRQWFIDPTKARNNRLLAVQHFDSDLKMVRQAVLESSDSAKFEHGVAILLFLLGFTPSVQLETDAPDLIVTTPGGKLAIIECTTRIADFAAKVGKLVDRRGALSKQLLSSGHPAEVVAVLICRLPRDQIAAQADDLRAHNTIMFAREDLQAAFDQVRAFNNPDKMLENAIARIENN